MAIGYGFRLEREDGTPADPPTFRSVTLNWKAGDTIRWGRGSFALSPSAMTTRISRRR
ncbi:MAG TPA: hypothetical protein VFL41_12375 [Gaiellaceae bacterium]|nr:hypothetical protein [Gaiellaceae bacterium]HET8652625.1 hypothetical protein [Gaiellaceae bacterium]